MLDKCPSIDEVIVVDDGSTDDTWSIVSSFPEVKGVHLPLNRGKGEALAEGSSWAKGDIFCFIDADVVGLNSGHLYSLVEPIQSGRVVMCVGMRGLWRYRVPFFRLCVAKLGGERALLRSVWEAIPLEHRRGYRVETAINAHCRRQNLAVAHKLLPGVYQVIKELKWGPWRGFARRAGMIWDVLAMNVALWMHCDEDSGRGSDVIMKP
jgi:hypothetical protein